MLAVACGVLVVTGTLSTAAGPHPGDSAEIERFWNLLDAVYIHVRATAAFGISFLLLLIWLAPQPRSRGRARAAAPWILLVLLLVQMAVGELQWRNAAAVVARADPRRPGGRRLGLDGRARHRSLAHPA